MCFEQHHFYITFASNNTHLFLIPEVAAILSATFLCPIKKPDFVWI
jgi:hypothetical protein